MVTMTSFESVTFEAIMVTELTELLMVLQFSESLTLALIKKNVAGALCLGYQNSQ